MKVRNKILSNSMLYFVIFLLLYTSRDTLIFGTNSDIIFKYIGYASILVVAALLFFLVPCGAFSRRVLFVSIVLGGFIICSLLSNVEISVKYAYELLLIYIAIKIVQQVNFSRFTISYVNIMNFFCVFSLIATLMYYVAKPLLNFLPTIVNDAGLKYYFLGFAVIPQDIQGVFYRNYGIFREPGVFVFFICVALFFVLMRKDFFQNKRNFFKVLLYSVTILTTYSTAGYIMLFTMVVGSILFMREINKYFKVGLIALLVVVVGVVVLKSDLFGKVFKKLLSWNSSTSARLGSFYINVEMLLRNPLKGIFGCGFSYVENNFSKVAISLEIGASDNTNTLFKILSIHGVFYFLLILYSLFRFFWKQKQQPIGIRITAFLVCCMGLCNEDLIMNILLYLLVAYSWAQFDGDYCNENS